MIKLELVTKIPTALHMSDITQLEKELSKILRGKSIKTASLAFVTEAKIQELNKKFRKKDKPTDVLSFEPDKFAQVAGTEGAEFLGDIVIASSYAKREAMRRGLTHREELLRLIVHGVLHLSGYDHATEKEEEQMFGLQERVVDTMVSV